MRAFAGIALLGLALGAVPKRDELCLIEAFDPAGTFTRGSVVTGNPIICRTSGRGGGAMQEIKKALARGKLRINRKVVCRGRAQNVMPEGVLIRVDRCLKVKE
jgi:hypothetical protein